MTDLCKNNKCSLRMQCKRYISYLYVESAEKGKTAVIFQPVKNKCDKFINTKN